MMQTNITQCQAGSPGAMVGDKVVVGVAVVDPGSRVNGLWWWWWWWCWWWWLLQHALGCTIFVQQELRLNKR